MTSDSTKDLIYQVLMKPKEYMGEHEKGNPIKAAIVSQLPEEIKVDDWKNVTLFLNSFMEKFDKQDILENKLINAQLYVDSGTNKVKHAKLDDQDLAHKSDEGDFININNNATLSELLDLHLEGFPFFSGSSKKMFEKEMKFSGKQIERYLSDGYPKVVLFKDTTFHRLIIYFDFESVTRDNDFEVHIKFNDFSVETAVSLDMNEVENNLYHNIGQCYIPKCILEPNEGKFLDDFKQEAKNENLFYNDEDLDNFHTSMRSDGMVILAGLSGTGKSQLVKCYGNALKLPQEQVKFVSVESNWTDDSDLMGFYDPSNNKYYPGKSGLVDTLLDAEHNPNKLYIVVFDEMNLSRVEQYFSQFLSVLEMDKGSREITLYNSVNEDDYYPEKIRVGDNVLFVGTINTDESTYKFSDKVLDRSNVIKLEMQKFTKMNEIPEKKPIDSVTIGAYSYALMKGKKSENNLKTSELELLWNLHKAINEVEPNVGIGWRIVNQINSYITNLPDSIDRFPGLDYQINQRVMTKISGSDQQLAELLGDANDDSKTGIIYEKLAEFLEKEKEKEKENEEIEKINISKKMLRRFSKKQSKASIKNVRI